MDASPAEGWGRVWWGGKFSLAPTHHSYQIQDGGLIRKCALARQDRQLVIAANGDEAVRVVFEIFLCNIKVKITA